MMFTITVIFQMTIIVGINFNIAHPYPEVNRHSSGNLHGQHAHHGMLHPVAQRAYLPNVVSVVESGFHHKQQEIPPIPHPSDRVPWNDSELPDNGDHTAQAEDQNDQAGSSPDPKWPTTYCSGSIQTPGEAECYHLTLADSTPLLSLNSDLPQTRTGTQPSELSSNFPSLRPSCGGSQVVETAPVAVEREEPNLSTNHSDHIYRCFPPGLGSCLQWEENERIMVTPRKVTPHKLPGASSSNVGDPNVSKDKSGMMILLKMDNTTAVAYIDRKGGAVSPTLSDLARDLWLWCIERKHHSLSTTFTRFN